MLETLSWKGSQSIKLRWENGKGGKERSKPFEEEVVVFLILTHTCYIRK